MGFREMRRIREILELQPCLPQRGPYEAVERDLPRSGAENRGGQMSLVSSSFALRSPPFLDIPGGAGSFLSGFDDSAWSNGITDDEMADLFGL